MTDRPILFSAPMVRALLAGTKTQTRRVVKLAPIDPEAEAVMVRGKLCFGARGNPGTAQETFNFTHGEEGEKPAIQCPYGVPGDKLWVREAHYLTNDGYNEEAIYAADETAAQEHLAGIEQLKARYFGVDWDSHVKLRPSIHMPRWASRLTLRITEVRVERLNDISHRDACAEGLISQPHHWHDPEGPINDVGYLPWEGAPDIYSEAPDAYRALWEKINGENSWKQNPWVWAVSFEVQK